MPLRAILRYLLNNEHIIQRLSESYPVRRAAQLTAYMFYKGKELGGESVEKLSQSDVVNRLQEKAQLTGKRASNFSSTFMKEVQEGLKEFSQKNKKDK